MTATAPFPVSVQLSPTLLEVLGEDACEIVIAEVKALAGQRGVPVADVAFEAAVTDALLTIDFAGDRFPVSARAVRGVFAYLHGRMRDVRPLDAVAVLDGLDLAAGSAAGRARTHGLGEFLALLCRAACFVARVGRPGAEASDGDITLRVHPDYLRELSTQPDADGMFPFLREGLFEELGIPLQSFSFHPDPHLRPRSFAFELAGLTSVPRIGLSSDSILVNDSVERLGSLGMDAHPAENPATGVAASVVAARYREQLEGAGVTTWTSFGYVILCTAVAVRTHAATLMTAAGTKTLLSTLGKAFPHLTGAAESQLELTELTAVLQGLVAEGVSVRNLRRILELLLRYQTLDSENTGPGPLAYVRAGLGDQISLAATRGSTTLVAYLLDEELEESLAAPTGADSAGVSAADRLLIATERESAHLGLMSMPVILTRPPYRQLVREAICRRLPHATVMSYGELPPWLSIQPVARISP